MSELEEKLGAILSNPQLMQQFATIAQSLGQAPTESAPSQEKEPLPQVLPDFSALQNAAAMLQKNNANQEQQELLHALTPFLSQGRIRKLERAMRAARMAGFASILLQSGSLNIFGGR